MLEVAKAHSEFVQSNDFKGLQIDHIEHRLILVYRQISELEQKQIRRLLEQLVMHPEGLSD